MTPAPAWSCRSACGKAITVTDDDIEALEVANRIMVARGEEPLRTDEIMLCPDCHRAWLADERQREIERRQIANELRELSGPRAWVEHRSRDLLDRLRAMNEGPRR